MAIKLFDSELHVMEVVWEKGPLPAAEIVKILDAAIGWNKNTTYTVIKKCVKKGAIQRKEPNFMCHALISKKQVQSVEVDELVNKLFGGSSELLFASLVDGKKLPADMIEKLKNIIGSGGEGDE